ncbi:MAG: energy-coupling factor transporter ATPase [Clostridia bacterium]|nr:energy-coupling factor transporter ATPase [Clostridia bacterium]
MQIKVEDLKYTYSPKSPFEKVALEGITFTVNEGDTIGIIGSTGSGKSTLSQHFNALIRVSHGKLYVGDMELHAKKVDLGKLRQSVGMLFQYPEYQLFADTVLQDVCFGPLNFGMSKEEAESRAKEAIELVGLNFDEVKDKSPFELSGGQKRRVAIAGIIASMPQVLVLDEPTAGLDPRGKRDILELVTKLKKSYCKTVIMISHNMDEIAEYCNRVIVLNNGKLLYDTTPRELFKDVKALEGTGLTPPHTAKIASLLANNGIIFSDLPLTVDEFVKAIKGGIAL